MYMYSTCIVLGEIDFGGSIRICLLCFLPFSFLQTYKEDGIRTDCWVARILVRCKGIRTYCCMSGILILKCFTPFLKRDGVNSE